MLSPLGKNLNFCFSRIKRTQSSQEEDHSRPLRSSTAASSIFFKNFNSLYDFTFDSTNHPKSFARSTTSDDDEDYDNHSSSESDTDAAAATPDFATVFASQRFFFSSPGRSNSIIDSSSSLSSIASSSSCPVDPPEPDNLVGGSIAIPTYSPDPFVDFRRSMQEMVEANDLIDVGANWDYLHELLMCYLSLNPKSTHKYIVGAFSDLLVSLMTSSPENGCRKSDSTDRGGRKLTQSGSYT